MTAHVVKSPDMDKTEQNLCKNMDIAEQSLPDSSTQKDTYKAFPSDLFHQVLTMPKNWEQVQRLKKRNSALRKDLSSTTITNKKANETELLKDSNGEIDLEITTSQEFEECMSKINEETSDAESDNSTVCLQIVEVIDEKESNDNEIENFKRKENSSAPASTTGTNFQGEESDDRASDLCTLSAADINSSLFDTIASLEHSGCMEPTNLKKQSSLENIITRIKTEAVSLGRSTVYHIQNPVTTEVQHEIEEGASQKTNSETDLFTLQENRHLCPKKMWKLKKNLETKSDLISINSGKGASTQVKQNLKKHLDRVNAMDKKGMDEKAISGKDSCPDNKFPMKLKLKNYLKMQKNAEAKIENQSDVTCKFEKGISGNDGDKTRWSDKAKMSIDKKDTSNDCSRKSSRTPFKGDTETSSPSDDLSLYKLKYECIQNQMKLLKYESRLIGLKEKLLEKKSMQHYFKTLMDKYASVRQEKTTDSEQKSQLQSSRHVNIVKSPVLKEQNTHSTSNALMNNLSDLQFAASTDEGLENMKLTESVNDKKSQNKTQENVDSAKRQIENVNQEGGKSLSEIRPRLAGEVDTCYTNITAAPVTSESIEVPVEPKVIPMHISAHSQAVPKVFHIQRPPLVYESQTRPSIRAGTMGHIIRPLTASTLSTQGPVRPVQSLHIVQVPPYGRLYAVVNNVLQPIVHNVNGQYLPVVNSTQSMRFPNSSQIEHPGMSETICNPAFLPVTSHSNTETTTSTCTPMIVISNTSASNKVQMKSLLDASPLRNQCISSFTKPVEISQASPNSTNVGIRLPNDKNCLQQSVPSALMNGNKGVKLVKQSETYSQALSGSSSPTIAGSGLATKSIVFNQNSKPTENENVETKDLGNKQSDSDQHISENKIPKSVTEDYQDSINGCKAGTDSECKKMEKDNSESTSVDRSNKCLCSEASLTTNPYVTVDMQHKDRLPVVVSNILYSSVSSGKVCQNDRNEVKLTFNLKGQGKLPLSVVQAEKLDRDGSCNDLTSPENQACGYPVEKQPDKPHRIPRAGSPAGSEESFDSIDWDRYEIARNECRQGSGQFSALNKTERNNPVSKSNSASEMGNNRLPKQTSPIPQTIYKHQISSATIKNDSQITVRDALSNKSSSRGPVKKLVKTKFIILKGEICERWQAIKSQTGYGGMSDPSFVHYLLKLEEVRQMQLARMQKHRQTDKPVSSKSLESSCCVQEHPCQSQVPQSASLPHTCIGDTYQKQQEDVLRNERIVATISHNSSNTISSQESNLQTCSAKRKIELGEEGSCPTSIKRGRFEFLDNNIKRQMTWAVSVFTEWLKEAGNYNPMICSKDASWLDKMLSEFYMKAKTLSGQPYPSTILQTFRRALSLALSMYSSIGSVRVGISLDAEYVVSNKLLASIMRTEKDKNIQPISNSDVEKLYSTQTFSDENPENLLWKVWFDIVYHLCVPTMPGHILGSLVKQNLCLESDVNGVYYCFDDLGYVPECEHPHRMYATPSKPERCPVRTTSLYLSKLNNKCTALFQCPSTDKASPSQDWYLPVPVDNGKLICMMETISANAGLSAVYSIANVMASFRRDSY